MKRIGILSVLIVAGLAVAACGSPATPTPGESNPASAFCTAHGNRLVFRAVNVEVHSDCFAKPGMACDIVIERPASAEVVQGFCLFADGTECERWAYYRGECAPGPKP